MGMFDDIDIEVALPDGYSEKKGFQTKDFKCNFDNYVIRSDGRLEVLRYDLVANDEDESLRPFKRKNERWERVEFHGVIRFYDYDKRDDGPLDKYDPTRWHEYEAKFTDGLLVSIKVIKQDD